MLLLYSYFCTSRSAFNLSAPISGVEMGTIIAPFFFRISIAFAMTRLTS